MLDRARSLRNTMTDTEQRIWYFLRDRRFRKYKFIRQWVIGNYIVDFICRSKKLIIELDGGQHVESVNYDKKRDAYLEQQGYKVLRIWDHEVFINIEGVLDRILYLLEC